MTLFHVGEILGFISTGKEGFHCVESLEDAKLIKASFSSTVKRKKVNKIYQVETDTLNLVEIPGDLAYWGACDFNSFLSNPNRKIIIGFDDEEEEVYELCPLEDFSYQSLKLNGTETEEEITAQIAEQLVGLGIDGFRYVNHFEKVDKSIVIFNIAKIKSYKEV